MRGVEDTIEVPYPKDIDLFFNNKYRSLIILISESNFEDAKDAFRIDKSRSSITSKFQMDVFIDGVVFVKFVLDSIQLVTLQNLVAQSSIYISTQCIHFKS